MQWQILIVIFLICDAAAFVFYGMDKRRARRGARRISERTLLICAVAGGIGAWLGMRVFHHKTRKLRFRLLVPLLALLQMICIGVCIINAG